MPFAICAKQRAASMQPRSYWHDSIRIVAAFKARKRPLAHVPGAFLLSLKGREEVKAVCIHMNLAYANLGSALIKAPAARLPFSCREVAKRKRKVTSRLLKSSLARFPFCALPPEKMQLFTDGIVMGLPGPTLVA